MYAHTGHFRPLWRLAYHKLNFKMKNNGLLNGLRWSRDSGSVYYDKSQSDVLGRSGGVFHGSTYYYDPIKALEWLAKYAFQTFLDMLSAIIDGHNDWYGHCCHRLVFLVRLCHSPFFADDTKKYWCLWLGRGVLLSVRCFRFLLYRKDRAKWFNMQGFGLFFSLFFLICGLSAIFLGFAWRRTGKCLPLQSFYSIM